MTLKELLDRCDFKDVAQALVKWGPSIDGALVPLKQAFDILRQLEPDPTECDELRLVASYDEVSQTYYFEHISRWGDTMEWKYELASEIVVEDGLTLTDAEIAAHCLWELTYSGFDQSTHEKWVHSKLGNYGLRLFGIVPEPEPENTNPYTEAAEKLKNELGLNDLDEINEDDGAWTEVKKLERMARVEEDIRRLTSNSNSFKREELEYLFKTKLVTFANRLTYAYRFDYLADLLSNNDTSECSNDDNSKRIDYLIDLLSNKDMPDYSCSTDFLLMFRTSSAYPLVQSEIDALQAFFSKFLPASANVRYGYGIDESLDKEVSLYLLGSY